MKLPYSDLYTNNKQLDLLFTQCYNTDSENDTRNYVVTDNVPKGHSIIDISTFNTNKYDILVCAFFYMTVMLIEVSRHGLYSTLAFTAAIGSMMARMRPTYLSLPVWGTCVSIH